MTFDRSLQTDPSNHSHHKIIAGILKDAAKKHFKHNRSDMLGMLWQDYDRFCQAPEGSPDEDFLFCRTFWCRTEGPCATTCGSFRLIVKTVTVDNRTFQDYYRDGRVDAAGCDDRGEAGKTGQSSEPTR